MPVPSPSPEPAPAPSTKPEEHKSFWGHVADVSDFLFATKSLGRILTGEGGWGDLASVGITAASFFIPPVRLLKFGVKPLESIIVHAAEVAASDTASVVAKRMAAKTADNARYLLENPAKHEELAKLAQTTDNAEITKLNNLHTEADHFLSTGTIPEPPIKRVGDTYKEPTPPAISEDLKTEFKAMKEAESTKTIDERIASGEDPNAPIKEAPGLDPESDAAKYPNLTAEELAMHRADGLSEQAIKAWDEWEAKQNAGKLLTEDKVLGRTEGRVNAADEVQAEFPVTAEGKPITRRMEDAMPEDMRTGNLKVDRTAWLISESKKLENFLKKKPTNAGEIRATKDLWNKKANELQLKMNPDERIQANELADKLTERSLADYKVGKDTLQRGVLDFDVSKETNLTKLTDTRTRLIDEWRAETNPDLKKGLAITGKKVAARIEELNKLPEVSSVVENSTLTKVRPNELSGDSAYENLLNDVMDNIINKHIGSRTALEPMSSKAAKRIEELGLDPLPDTVPTSLEVMQDVSTSDYITSSKNFKQLTSIIEQHYPVRGSHPADAIDSRDYIQSQTDALFYRTKTELLHTATLREIENEPGKLETLQEVGKTLEKIRNGKVCLAINGFDLEQVFKNELFLNQFATNTSRGTLNHAMRRSTEAIQHGTWLDALPGERAIYGYMAPTDADIIMKSVSGYGDFRVVFKPEVRSRTTFTYGDSLGDDFLPIPVEGELKSNQIYQALNLSTVKNPSPLYDVNYHDIYPEAQIFGKLIPNDIESVYLVPSRFGENSVNLEQVNKLKDIFEKFGIKFANTIGL